MGCTFFRNDSQRSFQNHDELNQLIKDANVRLYSRKSPILITPVMQSKSYPNCYFKLENHQNGGSFKLRAIYYKLYALYQRSIQTYKKSKITIVISNSRNIARACVFVKQLIEEQEEKQNPEQMEQQQPSNETPTDAGDGLIQIVLFMPLNKKKKHIQYCQVIEEGGDYLECERKAMEFANENHHYYVSSRNDMEFIASYGSIGKEIEEWAVGRKKEVKYVFVPVGSGALISGISYYLKELKRMEVQIVGVQATFSCEFYNMVSKQETQAMKGQEGDCEVADETDVCFGEGGTRAVELASKLVDAWVLVDREEVRAGYAALVEREKHLVEGSAGVVFAGYTKWWKAEQRVRESASMCVLCGQNVTIKEVQGLVGQ